MASLEELFEKGFSSGLTSGAVFLLKTVWKEATKKTWEDLYLDAFQAAVEEYRPYLEGKIGEGGEVGVDRSNLSRALSQDLSVNMDSLSLSQLTNEEFSARLAQAMEERSVLIIGGHNLSQQGYAQIVRNFVNRANDQFKQTILNNQEAFNRALLEEALANNASVREVQLFLYNKFNLIIDKLDQIIEMMKQMTVKVRPATVSHNLPQLDYEFVGRKKEMAIIQHRLLPEQRVGVVNIHGVGGVGKTTLAREIANYYWQNYTTLPADQRFDAIIWSSAKESYLTTDGIKQRLQALRTLDDLDKAITAVLELNKPDHPTSATERLELLRKALADKRTLLILDNLETVKDVSIGDFLRELPFPAKAIVTTRHTWIDVAYPLHLLGMESSEAKSLISQECDKKNVQLSDEQKSKLFERTGGVPLAIVWSIGRISDGRAVNTVLAELGNAQSDIAKFCFDWVIESIRGTDSYKVLIALAKFSSDAHREQLGYVAGFENDILSRDEALVKLEKLSLVNREDDIFNMLPLTKEYVLSELDAHTEFQSTFNLIDSKMLTLLDRRLKAGAEAELWVKNNQKALVSQSVDAVLVNYSDLQAKAEQFYGDIDNYLDWLQFSLKYGTVIPLERVNITPSLATKYYLEAFYFIKDQLVSKSLSREVATELKLYLDYLIDFMIKTQ